MQSRRPVSRAIDVLIELSKDVELRGTAYRNDYGDGATTHILDGRLTGADGCTYRFSAELKGVLFKKIETRGAKRKTGRNLALYFAFRLFLGCGVGRPEARRKVQALWEEKGWKGVAQDTQRDTLIRNGATVAKGFSVLTCVGEKPFEGAVVALKHAAFQITANERMAASGEGWFWSSGMECAKFGHIEFSSPLVRDGSSDGQGIGFIPDPVRVNFRPEK